MSIWPEKQNNSLKQARTQRFRKSLHGLVTIEPVFTDDEFVFHSTLTPLLIYVLQSRIRRIHE